MDVLDDFALPIWRGTAGGNCKYVNKAWLNFTGRQIEQEWGDGWVSVLHPEDRERCFGQICASAARSLHGGQPEPQPFRMLRHDGEYRWLKPSVASAMSQDATDLAFVCCDVTDQVRAANRLEGEAEALRQVAENSDQMLWVRDLETSQFFYISPGYERIWGRSRESLYADPVSWRNALHPDDRERVLAVVNRDYPHTITYRIVRPDGAIRWVNASVFPVKQVAGKTVRVAGIVSDITEQRQVADALQESEERLRQIAENTDLIIWLQQTDNPQLLYVSSAYERISGRTCESLYSSPRSWRELIHPDDRQRVEDVVMRQPQPDDPPLIFRIIRDDGEVRSISTRAFPIRDRTGNVVRIAGVAEDVTERLATEQALKDVEQRFRQLADNIEAVFWVWTRDEILYVSPAFEKIWGRDPTMLHNLPSSWRDTLYPPDRERVIGVITDGRPLAPADISYRIVRPDGEIRWIRDRVFPIRGESGEVERWAAITDDITEEKQVEDALRESEQRFRQLAENIEEVFWMWTKDELLYVSPAYETIYGRRPETLYDEPRSWRELIHPQDKERVLQSIVWGGNPPPARIDLEYRIIRPDGKIRWISDRVFPVRDGASADAPPRFAGVTHDITESKNVEEALRESEQRFRQLAENIDEVFWMWTRDPLQLLYVSPALEKMWGLDHQKLYQSVLSWREAIHPEDRKRVIREMAGPPEARVDTIYRIIRPDGQIRWMHDRVFPIPDERGKIIRWACVTHDITESKHAEQALEEANRQLRILSRRRVQVQEEERKFIALELHDQIGQALTATKIAIESAKRSSIKKTVVRQLDTASSLVDDIVQQVRRLSFDLRPPVLDPLGLIPALRSLVGDCATRSGWSFTFHDAPLERPDGEVEIACFRICLEALTNVMRHAEAKNVAVKVEPGRGEFRVSISDDGIGFDMAEAEKRIQRDHLGIVGMNERASAVGGRFECKSAPNEGTHISIVLPYHPV